MIVVKVGGAEGVDVAGVCADLAQLAHREQRWILIHGGSHETNVVATRLGHPPQFVTSVSGYTSRRTDRQTLEIFAMVYCGKINTEIVEYLQGLDVNAVGLSGVDGRLLQAKRKSALKIVDPESGRRRVLRDDFTGAIHTVNIGLLQLLLDAGYWPVISPPAISDDSEAVNVDGDRAAAAAAAALGAKTLLILSDVPGLLRSFPDERSLIPAVAPEEIRTVSDRYAAGRMKIKLLAAEQAIRAGVQRVVIGDSRRPHPVHEALDGAGTVIA